MKLSRLLPTHFLVTISLVTAALMLFSCIAPCGSSYATKPGLNRHQNACSVFRTSQALKIEQRRATKKRLSEATDEVKKLGTRKARVGFLDVGFDSVSLSPYNKKVGSRQVFFTWPLSWLPEYIVMS
jgi:hypothetical protein